LSCRHPARADTRVKLAPEKGAGILWEGFHDEALHGNWQGLRSSRLHAQYRVIYLVRGEEIAVHVERVTAHDYRR